MPNWVLPQGRPRTCGEYTSMSWASGFPRSEEGKPAGDKDIWNTCMGHGLHIYFTINRLVKCPRKLNDLTNYYFFKAYL